MTFGSLFSGAGGMDLGMDRAGLTPAWQCEISEFRRKVLAKHWPHVRRHDDVRTFPPGDPGDWQVDLLAGGFPCKQTSLGAAIHGRRKGLEGHESGLWFEMLRIVGLLKPSRIIVENVSGVETWSATIQAGLEGAGYAVRKLFLSAARVGAPHLRRRVFFAADVDRTRLSLTWPIDSPEAECEPWGAPDRDAWLSALPGVLRVADGLPAGIHRRERIAALGEAVCPKCAEWIGRRLMQFSTKGT